MVSKLTKHSELLRALSKLGPKERLALIKCLDDNQIECICECIYNTLKGQVDLTADQKRSLARHKTILRRMVTSREKIKKKKQILIQNGGAFLPFVLGPLLGGLLGSLFQ
uniref:Uncharacterized protein n=1 Tax=Photinus pyralis TaxID=7054 RepID=A0A1Y1ND17_PHOPY